MHQLLGIPRRGEVHLKVVRPHAVQQCEALGQLRETGVGKRDENQVHTQASTLLGEGAAKALACAGDESDVLLGWQQRCT
jgi:hypothetical protein